jgi:methionine aminopeptidase
VASGANSAIPHHRPTDAVLADGDFVKIDFGALVGGYHSDMTRTFVWARPPTGNWRSTSWSAPRSGPAGLRYKPEPAWPTWTPLLAG